MRNSRRPTVAPVAVLAVLAGILMVLAVLQYRWISQVSRANRERMQAGLENASRQYRQEFNRELLGLCLASQLGFGSIAQEDWERVAERLDNWSHISPYAGLLKQVYIWETGEDSDGLLRLNQRTEAFEETEWPSEVFQLQQATEEQPRWAPGWRNSRIYLLQIIDDKPFLLHSMYGARRRYEGQKPQRFRGYLAIELDRQYLSNVFFPELGRRYFVRGDEPDFVAAVTSVATDDELLYTSAKDLTAEDFESSDVRVPLVLGPSDLVALADAPPGRPGPGEPSGRDRPAKKSAPPSADRPGFAGGTFGAGRGPVVLLNPSERSWHLVVKHREGSLDSAVESLRRRNLAVSFGILILLAASVGMIYVSAQRARRLADLQMEFVAGVSHELRTPLAVIRSAAENLADGVVGAGNQVREYGRLIGSEGRRLSTMIEQTLELAATESGEKVYELTAVSIESVVERTIAELRGSIEEAGVQVESRIQNGLPAVRSNPEAVGRVLANLMQNALKYGGDAKWMAIRARAANTNGKAEVELRVEDRGVGIDPDDLPHIFEPFYRGKQARSNQTQGSGLGLHLAQRISEAVGARLTVVSQPGQGSSFSLHLPVAESSKVEPELHPVDAAQLS